MAFQQMPLPQTNILVGASQGAVDPKILSNVHKIAQSLIPPIPNWNITVLPEQQWNEWMKMNPSAKATDITFSLMGANRTFIRQSFLKGKSDDQIRDQLAHEMGHLVSGSHDEDVANKTKANYFKTKSWQ